VGAPGGPPAVTPPSKDAFALYHRLSAILRFFFCFYYCVHIVSLDTMVLRFPRQDTPSAHDARANNDDIFERTPSCNIIKRHVGIMHHRLRVRSRFIVDAMRASKT